jgi:hypothetical protein
MKSYNDFNFSLTYSGILREVVSSKVLVSNTFGCPKFVSGCLFLELSNLDNFDSSRLVAASFILTILSHRRPYIIRFRLFETFHEKDYDITVQVNLIKTTLFNFIKILASDILPFLSKVDFEKSFGVGGLKGNLVCFTIC